MNFPLSDSNSDSEGYDYDPEVTLESIEKGKTINFSIRANYTNWAPREAFRELVQNWRDGIIRSFHLAEKDFCIVRREKTSSRGTEIIYLSFRVSVDNDEKEWLGYIRFSTKAGNDSPGTVELTNRAATLQPRHLDLGGTTKKYDASQAGAHGEGLKLALLVLMRGGQNHSVRCRSGGFNWRFNFSTTGRLVCRLRRMTPQAIERAVDQARRLSERTLLPFAARPKGDVQFVIGETVKGRDQRGNSVQRRGVTQQEFEDWTKCALFLCNNIDGDGAVISTMHGDLLMDERLRGNIYLKGLLLGESTLNRSASITNRPLKYGYNFAHGQTNRERQSLAGAYEECAAILSIWGSVLTSKPEMAAPLSDMLNDPTTPTCADVLGADRLITASIATILRDHLTTSCPNQWFFTAQDKAQNSRLDQIITGLGYQPTQLEQTYWTVLRKYNLFRTAEEEQQLRFTAAPIISIENSDAGYSSFAISVQHFLRACGRACPQTKDIAFHFVQAGNLHIRLFYAEEEHCFRVHDRWLCLERAVEELGLPWDSLETDVVFHTVKGLFSDALKQLDVKIFETPAAAEEGGNRVVENDGAKRTGEWRLRLEISMAEQRLMSCLRMAGRSSRLHVVEAEEGFWVSVGRWPDDEAFDGVQRVEAQCHLVRRCGELRGELLIAEDADTNNLACIGHDDDDDGNGSTCRVYRYRPRTGTQILLDELETGEEYFVVLVTPQDPRSFVAISDVIKWTKPRTPTPSPVRNDLGASRHSTVADVMEPASSIISSSPSSHSENHPMPPSPSPPALSSPMRSEWRRPGLPVVHLGTDRAIPATPVEEPIVVAAAGSSAIAQSPHPASFTLGPRLESLDIFKVDRERWYEARNESNIQAVIGIFSGEKTHQDESRKRQRVEQTSYSLV